MGKRLSKWKWRKKNLRRTAVGPRYNGQSADAWNCKCTTYQYWLYVELLCDDFRGCDETTTIIINCHLHRAINGTWEYVELVSIGTSPMAMYDEDFAALLPIRHSCAKPAVMLLIMIWHLDNWCCKFITKENRMKGRTKKHHTLH